MKKFVSLLLALALAASLAVPAAAAQPATGSLQNFVYGEPLSFYDVLDSYWFTDYADQVSALGLMTGRSEGEFAPWDTITGMEAVALTARIVSTYYYGDPEAGPEQYRIRPEAPAEPAEPDAPLEPDPSAEPAGPDTPAEPAEPDTPAEPADPESGYDVIPGDEGAAAQEELTPTANDDAAADGDSAAPEEGDTPEEGNTPEDGAPAESTDTPEDGNTPEDGAPAESTDTPEEGNTPEDGAPAESTDTPEEGNTPEDGAPAEDTDTPEDGVPEEETPAAGTWTQPWYQPYYDYLANDTEINPYVAPQVGLPATRMQVAYLLAHALPAGEMAPINDGIFTQCHDQMNLYMRDVNASTPYHTEIETLYRCGVCVGTGSFGDFEPTSNISRAEMSAMVVRLVDPSARQKLNWTTDVATILSQITSTYQGNYTVAYAENHDFSPAVKELFVNYKGYSSNTGYLVWVNRQYQHVYVFTGSKGNWTLHRTMLCGTGKSSTPTPVGVFRTTYKQPGWYDPTYTVYHVTRFYGGGYAFHSQTYYPHGSKVLQGNVIGYPCSHGCVRMYIADAKWFQDTIPAGTTVVVY
ncbi:MAG: L,D-transpeptidase family protein [Oscillospiraceae bacterium]|nr:L,D-transpeptidase family protein [Oscillospiraceae bacterium]